jgi:threonyl-tRNA synthetase
MNPNDHRAIGKRLELFHFQEEAPGMVFWHPKGLAMVRELEEANRRFVRRAGYQEVRSPQLIRAPLWERSGHWQHFREHMFVCEEEEGQRAALKPVSCPGHLSIASRMSLSYRDLPLRFSELGVCHRNEQSGALAGLFRLRQFVQDDGHILCAEQQVVEEVAAFCLSIVEFYRAFGFERVSVALAERPEPRMVGEEPWDHAEAALAEGARAAGLEFERSPGAGAFYGPKLEFSLQDQLGRVWQCGTIQVDHFLPARFGVEYVDASGHRIAPVMLHRALCGSLERFLGIVLEQHKGRVPAWLSPEQVHVLPVSVAEEDAARALVSELRAGGLSARLAASNEGLGKRVALAHAAEIPYVVVLGPRELAEQQLDLRAREGRSLVERAGIGALLQRALQRPW